MSDPVIPVPNRLEGECKHIGTFLNVSLFIGDIRPTKQQGLFVVVLGFLYLKLGVCGYNCSY